MWTFKIKSLVMVFLMIILNTLLAFGQDVPLDSMKTPESPAFMLLGISPTNFSKPETPNAFAVNVLNGFSNKDIVPQNFAIETAPYWWFQQYNLTFYEYINPGIWQSIQQNFSFSAATSKISSAPGGTFLAGGVRTIICPGSYDSGKLDSLVNEYYKQSIKQDFYTNIVESDINNKNYNLDSIIEKELKEYTKPKKINISNEELQKKLDEIRTVKNNYFKTKKKETNEIEEIVEEQEVGQIDDRRRKFLKVLTSTGLATVLLYFLNAKKAQAAFFGSVPGPGTISIKDSEGKKIDPAVNSPTDGYTVSNVDDDTFPNYYGFINKDSNWYIQMAGSDGTFLFANNSNNTVDSYSDAWTGRTTLTYNSFDVAF